MWVADKWKDYEVIDTSSGEKLERWGKYILLRPDPQVIWDTPEKNPFWKKLNAHYHRSSRGGGKWEFFDLPKTWTIEYALGNAPFNISRAFYEKDVPYVSREYSREKDDNDISRRSYHENKQHDGEKLPGDPVILRFNLQPFKFKHTGLFPEQAVNWEWIYSTIKSAGKKNIKVLNLFAYTGGATLAALAAGAEVTHVDASKGMVTWAKENSVSSSMNDRPVRWLVDDCKKFVEREIRRGHHYDAVIMDPPSYGRGPKGEIWKLEDDIYHFLKLCTQIITREPLFVLLNSYTTGLQPAVLTYMLSEAFAGKFGGYVESDEIGLPVTDSGLILPCGASGRYTGPGI